MVWEATESALVIHPATFPATPTAEQIGVTPSAKVTVPDGVPPAGGVRVSMKVTDWS
jgi:hypothetical protein